jgi:hypothetical protein
LWFLPTALQLRRGEFVVFSPFLHQRIGARYRGIAVAAQEISRPVAANFDVSAMETLRRRSWGRGKPGVAGFRGPYRAHRGDDIRRSSGHTSKDIAKYLGVSRATLYRYLAEDGAA